MKQKVYSDIPLQDALHEIIDSEKLKSIFLVHGKKSFEQCGARKVCEDVLTGVEITHFSDFSANPKIEDIEKGIELIKKSSADVVIAVGGGSVIDIAKSINELSSVEGDIKQYITGEKAISDVTKPLVAVPTTSGSGSEATHFAVVYIDKKKYSLAHHSMLPEYVVLVPNLTNSMSPYITACTGFDALAQAVESMWSTASSEESKEYARESIGLIRKSFAQAVNDPDAASRADMQRGAYLAGKAINISKTTASHAMSYALTSTYNIPHGHAVGLTLGALLAFNAETTEETLQEKRGLEYLKETIDEIVELLGVSTPLEAYAYLTSLLKEVGLATKLNELNVVKSDIPALASAVSAERAKNNPRYFDSTYAEKILGLTL